MSMREEPRQAVVSVTLTALASLLDLPDGVDVVAVLPPTGNTVAGRYFEVLVRGPGLPVHREGDIAHRLDLSEVWQLAQP